MESNNAQGNGDVDDPTASHQDFAQMKMPDDVMNVPLPPSIQPSSLEFGVPSFPPVQQAGSSLSYGIIPSLPPPQFGSSEDAYEYPTSSSYMFDANAPAGVPPLPVMPPMQFGDAESVTFQSNAMDGYYSANNNMSAYGMVPMGGHAANAYLGAPSLYTVGGVEQLVYQAVPSAQAEQGTNLFLGQAQPAASAQSMIQPTLNQAAVAPAAVRKVGSGKGKRKRRDGQTYRNFFERIEDLQAFKKQHGHLDITCNHDKSLSQFCSIVRHARKHAGKKGIMRISAERVAALDAIGFPWGKAYNSEDSTNTNVVFGNALPLMEQPQSTSNALVQVPLGVAALPAQFVHPMIQGQENILVAPSSNGNATSPKRGMYRGFQERMSDLKAFKKQYGHMNVSSSQDKSLAQFCSIIRHARKHAGRKGVMRLSAERIAALDGIGFMWKIRERK